VPKYYHINPNLFDTIDCRWKAYFLGWMYSDGNVDKQMTRATIALKETDRAVLDYFAIRIYGPNGPTDNVQYRKPYLTNFPKRQEKRLCSAQRTLRINSCAICAALARHGVVPAKSLILEYPPFGTLPHDLFGAFLQGYFEGDGTVRDPRKRHGVSVSMLGTKAFLEGVKAELDSRDIISIISASRTPYSLNVHGTENIVKLGNLMYEGADFALARKRERLAGARGRLDDATKGNESSRYRGITYKDRIKRYVARATVDKVRYNIGCYKTEDEAYQARVNFLRLRGQYTDSNI